MKPQHQNKILELIADLDKRFTPVDSISTLEIAARTMFLLQDEYTVDGKTQNDLTQDVLNTQYAVDNLLAIQAKAIARIEIIEQAPLE